MEVELLEAFEELPQDLRPPLLKVIKAIQRMVGETVRRDDFLDLKAVVSDLAEIQRGTEKRLEELTEAQKKTEERLNQLTEAQKRTEERLNQLTEAQKRTEERLNQLAEAQKRTEERLNQLAEAQKRTAEEVKKLATGLRRVRREVGGLSRSVAYALENEAFRRLPQYLRDHYAMEILDRIVRAEIEGEEINLFCKAKRDGKEAYLVGEAVLRLDDKTKLRQLWKKVEIVKESYGGEVIPILVTHFAKKELLKLAEKAGIIVVQSFEW